MLDAEPPGANYGPNHFQWHTLSDKTDTTVAASRRLSTPAQKEIQLALEDTICGGSCSCCKISAPQIRLPPSTS